jgi:hypothetical protein
LRIAPILLLCAALFSVCLNANAGNGPDLAGPDASLAKQCVQHALQGGEDGYLFLVERLFILDRENLERLAALVREETLRLTKRKGTRITSQEKIRMAWLHNFLDMQLDRLVYDAALDGYFVRNARRKGHFLFRDLSGREMIVRLDPAGLGPGYYIMSRPRFDLYVRIFWRNAPDGADRSPQVIRWRGLDKHEDKLYLPAVPDAARTHPFGGLIYAQAAEKGGQRYLLISQK